MFDCCKTIESARLVDIFWHINWLTQSLKQLLSTEQDQIGKIHMDWHCKSFSLGPTIATLPHTLAKHPDSAPAKYEQVCRSRSSCLWLFIWSWRNPGRDEAHVGRSSHAGLFISLATTAYRSYSCFPSPSAAFYQTLLSTQSSSTLHSLTMPHKRKAPPCIIIHCRQSPWC